MGVSGSAVYMTQNGGRGAIAPISTLCVWSGGRVSKSVTASLAVASARSLPRTFVRALIFRRVVEKPFPGGSQGVVRCSGVEACGDGSVGLW